MKLHSCLAALVAAAVLAPAAGAVTLPPGFDQQQELTGLTRPTKIAWAPDGRRFVAEKDGVLRVADATGTASRVLLDLSQEVNSFSDRGLLGLAVDSDFATHPYIYVSYTYDLRRTTDPDSAAPMVAKLRRLRLSPDSQVLESKVLLGSYDSAPCPDPDNDLDCLPADGLSHSIGTVISAPDGTLFVGNGDAADYNYTDPLALRSYDDESMAGKVLHVDRDGRGVAGHPRCPSQADLAKVCTKVYAKGFRNPFRFSRRPNGTLLVADVGWSSTEEISMIRSIDAGASYGWPCYEGYLHTPSWEDRPACQPEYAKENTPSRHFGPIYAYGHAGSDSAVIAGPEYTGSSYPAEMNGSAFFGDYGQGFIKRLTFHDSGYVNQVFDFAQDWHGVDLSAAPGGDLTWADPGTWSDGEGFIGRVVYSPDNQRPTAVAQADPTSGPVPLDVQFDGSGSSDPEDDDLTYDWDFGDGSAHSSQESPAHTYAATGSYTASLSVSDGDKSHSDSVQIDAANTPPVPQITAPADGSLYRDGVPLTVKGTATDSEENPFPVSGLEFDVTLIHGSHTHFYDDFSGVDQITLTPFDDHDADSHYEIRLTARDSHGASASTTIAVRPETVPLHLRSEPPGAPLSYAGLSLTAPHDRDAAVGVHTTVSAAASFQRDGRTFVFDRWSDGGERAHDITVQPSETTLTARYLTSSGPFVGPVPGVSLPVAEDRSGPLLRFGRRGFDVRRAILTGRVGDPAGVRRVELALALVRRNRCRWLAARPRALATRASSCARPRWIAARLWQGATHFSLRLPKRLGAGAYRLRFRALDALGNRSGKLADGRASVPLRVPARR